jgi:putative hemolysin
VNDIALEIILIVALIIANGVFSLSEIAIISARKARLQSRAERGDRRARAVIDLSNRSTEFLSTVQIGITLVGILTGVFGGATIAEQLAQRLDAIDWIAPHGESAAVTIVVIAITYLTLILGELIPKRLALANPERVALVVARPMVGLARIATPLVRFLSWSTEILIKLLRIPRSDEPAVTEEELTAMMRVGAATGAFHPAEEKMVRGVFALADRPASMVMKRRHDLVWLDANRPRASLERQMIETRQPRYPVGDGALDRLIGVIDVRDVAAAALSGRAIDVRALARSPLIIHEHTSALLVLEQMQTGSVEVAIVIDDYGSVAGMITRSDLAASVLGDDEPALITRPDGTLLVDGMMKFDTFSDVVPLPGVDGHAFETVAGFVVARLGRIPSAGDRFNEHRWTFEVLDMDGRRIDKILVSRVSHHEP